MDQSIVKRSDKNMIRIPDMLRRYLPILTWAKYSRRTFTNDLMAAMIVTIMLIPQSLAYALLVGLPPAGRTLCLDGAACALCNSAPHARLRSAPWRWPAS